MSAARFVVGIDLGTTNSAVAYVDNHRRPASEEPGIDTSVEAPKIEMFAIAQLVAPGSVEPRPTQPSFLYLPAEAEFKREQLALPLGQSGCSIKGHLQAF